MEIRDIYTTHLFYWIKSNLFIYIYLYYKYPNNKNYQTLSFEQID